ncbi:glutamine--fructose-6-phosphate transaminase (isomerizing) [Thermopetrobacter sp. TC1]|uniref:glutamine--fructose-6-phosphate transaminase (isomerizing) n=1 Tax=Thermopetrobacter sp. TC1 TaxID=1495045 RepID=UPI000570EA31|nr:glutamine--fructose-6-phosphate transaminase (isomerizing) [Thermopetrobacter sp. TC1]
MCGIVGIIGTEPVAMRLYEALKRLEYRGYDSAGIAFLEEGRFKRLRAAGKLNNLLARIQETPSQATIGIGHTRWATHGAPTEENAHPHIAGSVAIVHNGIIENFQVLKAQLEEAGVTVKSDTDTEIVAHLIDQRLKAGEAPQEAVRSVLKMLEGAFAFVIMFEGEDDLLIAARRGSPLAIGHGDGEMFLGSDAIALAPFTSRVTYLEDGDMAVVRRDRLDVFDEAGRQVVRPLSFTQASALLVDKGGHRHFMAKEIAEQPDVIGHTLAEYVNFHEGRVTLPDMPVDLSAIDRITITACGTAHYAGMVAKYWIERLARLPVEVDVASEFRYREAPLKEGGLSLVISQSGETADTLAALRYCKEKGQVVAAVVNVPESTIARESDVILRTYAGPEIGVASTKAFTCQLAVLAAFAIHLARMRGCMDADEEKRLVKTLSEVPRLVVTALKQDAHIDTVAQKIAHARDILYLGRGINYPIALEGALKLKEISYIHAEGYAAGELKHGPIALIDENVPVVVIAPRDKLFDKTVSNMQEVAARGARIVLITDEEGARAHGAEAFETIAVPAADPFVSPILYAIPVQLLAYHAAVFLGTDVDQPRNLAKSVTVE